MIEIKVPEEKEEVKGDLISRQAVIYYIKPYIQEIITESGVDKNEHANRMLRAIINGIETMPTGKEEPAEDCISRQEAISAIQDKYYAHAVGIDIVDNVAHLPSVTPKAEQKWIPCTERLPDKLQNVLVTFYDAEGEYDVAYMRKTFNSTYIAQGVENEWVSAMGETEYADYEVSAWMPLMPYKAESEVEE